MAKSRSTSYNKVAGALALIAVLIAGVLGLITFIFSLFDGSVNFGRVGSLLNLIANVFLFVSVVMVSWQYLCGTKLKSKPVIVILYWVIVICGALGFIGIGIHL